MEPVPDPTDPIPEPRPAVFADRLKQEVHGTANTVVGDHNTLMALQTENPEVASLFVQAYLGQERVPAPPPVPTPTPITLEDDLLPRDGLQAQVERALRETASVIVTGPPGMGKSTLLKQIAVRRGGVYLQAGRRSPTRVVRQLLETLEPGSAAPQDIDAMLDAVEAALHARPRLLLVDLGDEPEGIMAHLGQLESCAGLVFAATAHPRSAPRGSRELRLPPLTEPEIRDWLGAHGRELPPGELIRLVETSAGHPLYLRAYLKLEGAAFPPDLGDLEAHLWRQCDEVTQDILALISLSYRPLDVSEVTELLASLGQKGVTPADTMATVTRSRGLIEGTGGHLAPFHAHFRAFVEQHLEGQGAAASYHCQLAEHALRRGSAAGAGSHLLKTRGERLKEVAERGGLEAFAAGEWALAAELLDVAEEDALRRDRFQDAGRVALQQASVLTAVRLGGAQEAAQRAIYHFDRAGDADGVTAAKVFRSVLKINTARNAEGLEELEAAQQHFQAHPPADARVQGMLDVNLSFAYIHAARFREGMQAADRAARALGGAGDEFGEATALQNYSGCAAKLGELDEARRTAEQLIGRATALDQPRWAAAGHNTLTIVHRKRGEPALAEQHAREAVRFSQRLASIPLQALNLACLGNTLMDQERVREAEGAYQEALALLTGEPGQWPDQEAHVQELIARIRMDEGCWDEALVLVQEALEIQREFGDTLRVATLHEKLSAIQAQAEQWEDAAQAAEASARAYAPEFPSDSVTRWSEAAVLWAETPELARSLQAVQNAFAQAYPGPEATPDVSAATDLLATLLDQEDGHFLMLLLRSVTRWAVKHGDRDPLVPLTRSLRDQVMHGHTLAAAGLAFVIADGDWDPASLQRLADDLKRGRVHLHHHGREDGSGVWTIGVQTSPPFVAQVNVFTESPEVQAAGLALSLLLDTQAAALDDVLRTRSSSAPLPDTELVLASQQDQEEYFPSLDLGRALDHKPTALVTVEDGPALCVLGRSWTASRALGKARYGRGYPSLVIDLATALLQTSWVPEEEQEQAARQLAHALLH